MRISKYFILIFFVVGSCIDPLKIDITSDPKKLVVDGLITDQPGPYKVELYLSNDINPIVPAPFQPVEGATLFIHDDLGNSYQAYENSPGIYLTDSLEVMGQVGRTYYLTILTATGNAYQSSSQLLKSNGSIDELRFDFDPESLQGNKPDEKLDALYIRMDATGVGGGDNLFRWRWTTTIKVKTYPELRTTVPEGSENDIPDPDPCSGYVLIGGALVKISECICCYCWSSSYSQNAYVSPTGFVDGISFNNVYLGMIPVTPMHFYEGYYISVEQLSLSEGAFDFWQLVQKQQEGATNLFQPNAIKIRGNVRNIDDAKEEVLGYFGVSSVAKKGVFIDQSVIPNDLGPIEVVPFSCLISFPNTTTEKPPFW